MQTWKAVVGVIAAIVPVAYCGGLLYYFIHGSGSIEAAQSIGLGPTILGLGIVGVLFCIALLVKIAWVFASASSSSEATPRKGLFTRKRDDDDGDDGFDADAVIARHLARRSTEAATGSPTAPAPDGGPARPTFGRKVR